MESDEQSDKNIVQQVLAKNDAKKRGSRSILFREVPGSEKFCKIHRKITMLEFCQ